MNRILLPIVLLAAACIAAPVAPKIAPLDRAETWATPYGWAYGVVHEATNVMAELEPNVYLALDENLGIVVLAVSSLAKANECRVVCASGYYACCLINQAGEPVCRCRPNSHQHDADCQSGGLGASECGITRDGTGDGDG